MRPDAWAYFAARTRIPGEIGPTVILENLHLFNDEVMTHVEARILAGDLCTIYDACMAYVQAKLNTALIPHARGRDERLELPENALREVLVNTLTHRDYRSIANVRVHVFHDRLEVVTLVD